MCLEFPLECPNCGGDIRLFVMRPQLCRLPEMSRLTSNWSFASETKARMAWSA